MSRTPTLILLVVAAALGLAAFLLLRPGGGTTETTHLLPPIEQPPTSLTVWREGDLVCRAERRVAAGVPGWMQLEPIEYPLRSTAIESILQEARGLTPIERAEGSAAELGLTPPRAALRVGEAGTLELGRRTVAGQAVARLAGAERAHVVSEALHRLLLDTDAVAWRKRDVFDNLGVEVARIRIDRTDAPPLKLARLRGVWRVIEPVGEVADQARVQTLLAYLIDSQVQSFVLDQPGDLEQFGLAPPTLTATAETDRRRVKPDGEIEINTDRQALHVGGVATVDGTLHYARRAERDVVVSVSTQLVDVLRTPLADWISPVASPESPSDVAAVEIDKAGEAVLIERTLDGWTHEGGGAVEGPADDPAARAGAALTLLLEAEARAVLPPADDAEPLSAPVLVLTLRGFDDGKLATFEVRVDADADLAVRNPLTGVVRLYDSRELSSTLLK